MNDSHYFKIYGWMLREDLTATESVVLAYIAANCEWNDGLCERSLKQFSEDLKMSEQTARRTIQSLQGGGYICIETKGDGKGNKTQMVLAKGLQNDTLSAPKGYKMNEKGLQNDTLCDSKGLQNDTLSPFKKEKDIFKEKREKNAHTREELEGIIRTYESRVFNPNGCTDEPTPEETATYEDAKARLMDLNRARLASEWNEVLEQYPALKAWHEQGRGDHFARLVETYGKEAVMEAVTYTANRLDLQYSYRNPLGYIENNLKRRTNNGR